MVLHTGSIAGKAVIPTSLVFLPFTHFQYVARVLSLLGIVSSLSWESLDVVECFRVDGKGVYIPCEFGLHLATVGKVMHIVEALCRDLLDHEPLAMLRIKIATRQHPSIAVRSREISLNIVPGRMSACT
jgi:hypothetical protein